MSLRLNPEYEKLLPKMPDDEFAELKESIQQEGQHYPIVANENLEVLDGHHRFKACIELGIEPDFEVRKFEDKIKEKKFVIEANLRRRHLNNFQLIELAVPLLEIEKALAKKRQSNKGKNEQNVPTQQSPTNFYPVPKGKAAEIVAKKAGISTRTLERGKKIIEEATEEEKQKLREGKTSISRVYSDIVYVNQQNHAREKTSPINISKVDLLKAKNKKELQDLLRKLVEGQLFCPSCGNSMLECSQCHKTLQESMKQ